MDTVSSYTPPVMTRYFRFFCFVFLIILSGFSLRGDRDPFWPIGYTGEKEAAPAPTPIPNQVQTGPEPTPEPVRELTEAELRELERQKADQIRKNLVRKGTVITNDKIYAYVQKKWVTVGDVVEVEVLGKTYRLEIIKLTSNDIQLKAHRAIIPIQTEPRNTP